MIKSNKYCAFIGGKIIKKVCDKYRFVCKIPEGMMTFDMESERQFTVKFVDHWSFVIFISHLDHHVPPPARAPPRPRPDPKALYSPGAPPEFKQDVPMISQ